MELTSFGSFELDSKIRLFLAKREWFRGRLKTLRLGIEGAEMGRWDKLNIGTD
jgi:hypothetical protein